MSSYGESRGCLLCAWIRGESLDEDAVLFSDGCRSSINSHSTVFPTLCLIWYSLLSLTRSCEVL